MTELKDLNTKVRRTAVTSMQAFWYIVMNIWFGAAYMAKVPVKKALEEVGLAEMTDGERFWYTVMNISFGSGYFAKLAVSKALTEVHTWPDNI